MCMILLLIMYYGIPITYHFMHPIEQVQDIKLVEVYVEGKNEFSYICIKEINVEDFFEDFNKMDYKWHLNGPTSIYENTIAFRINYINGDYEVFDCYGRYIYQVDEGIKTRGTGNFNTYEFEELLNKYR